MNQLMHRNADELAALRAAQVPAAVPATRDFAREIAAIKAINKATDALNTALRSLCAAEPHWPAVDSQVAVAMNELKKVSA